MTNTTEQALRDALEEERRLRIIGQQPDIHWESIREMRRACYAATDAARSMPPSEQEPVAAEFFAYHTEMGAVFLRSLGEARECCVKNLKEERKEANSTGEWCDESAESVRYGIVLGRAKFFPDSEHPDSGDYRMVDNPTPPPAEARSVSVPDEVTRLLGQIIDDMENGFVVCSRCGEQEDTKTLDFMSQLHSLRAMLSAAPKASVPDEVRKDAAKWHAPGLGEVHHSDHRSLIYCETENAEGQPEPDDGLARFVCSLLNSAAIDAALAEKGGK